MLHVICFVFLSCQKINVYVLGKCSVANLYTCMHVALYKPIKLVHHCDSSLTLKWLLAIASP